MKERPILFSGPMVKAILAGTKTQTRRLVSPQPEHRPHHEYGDGVWQQRIQGGRGARLNVECVVTLYKPKGPRTEETRVVPLEEWLLRRCPYGVGDRLWVRETFASDGIDTLYAADCRPEDLIEERAIRRAHPGIGAEFPGGKWRPSIFMPRKLSRLTLEVTEVRVRRLQEISEEDAKAEGMDPGTGENVAWCRFQFSTLWDSINGKRAPWASNPWVWAITFRRVD